MDPVQVVQEHDDAFYARDLDRFARCFSPDAVIVDGMGHVFAQGRDAIRALHETLFSQGPDCGLDVVARIHAGSWVADEERMWGIVEEGSPPDVHQVVVFRVENDQIVRAMILS
jgi:hypothetical protein